MSNHLPEFCVCVCVCVFQKHKSWGVYTHWFSNHVSRFRPSFRFSYQMFMTAQDFQFTANHKRHATALFLNCTCWKKILAVKNSLDSKDSHNTDKTQIWCFCICKTIFFYIWHVYVLWYLHIKERVLVIFLTKILFMFCNHHTKAATTIIIFIVDLI